MHSSEGFEDFEKAFQWREYLHVGASIGDNMKDTIEVKESSTLVCSLCLIIYKSGFEQLDMVGGDITYSPSTFRFCSVLERVGSLGSCRGVPELVFLGGLWGVALDDSFPSAAPFTTGGPAVVSSSCSFDVIDVVGSLGEWLATVAETSLDLEAIVVEDEVVHAQ